MSKSKKLPYMAFYPGDWKKDLGVQTLSFHDRAVWFEMLMLMHESEQRGLLILNGKPMSHETIAKLIGLDKQIFLECLNRIIENGVCSVREDGAIFNRKMVKSEDISLKRSICGSMGGNPNLLKQKNQSGSYPNADIDIDNVNEDLNKKNSLQVPESLKCEEITKAIANWEKKLKSQGRTLDQLTLDAQLASLGLNKARILAAINYSCSLTKCLNLLEKPDKTPLKYNSKPPDKPRPVLKEVPLPDRSDKSLEEIESGMSEETREKLKKLTGRR